MWVLLVLLLAFLGTLVFPCSPKNGNAQIVNRAKEIKMKLGTLLQKPENAADLSIPCKGKQEQKSEKLSRKEVLQWHESFDKLLRNSHGIAALRSFLVSEFSEENIDFWLACEDFKKTKSPAKMVIKAEKIYQEFIKKDGPREVNIDHITKDVTLKNLVNMSPSSFDLAQKHIFALMEKDSFSRFLKSHQYQDLIK